MGLVPWCWCVVGVCGGCGGAGRLGVCGAWFWWDGFAFVVVQDEKGNYKIDLSKADNLEQAYREMNDWAAGINATDENNPNKAGDPLLTIMKDQRSNAYSDNYNDGLTRRG